ncbi:IS66 family transposase [Ligilactobacillus acidipiscis]|uniref:IS66 family transposase n=1 Tax=Ligilactobacillus acidipiscis TaxID=89059 RepID=UPI0023F8808D|nr:transposase [Ligilactobacillus acidipiscis]WEV58128.1 transposase [Ligilactobacillus acidipiscis]
MKLIKKPTIKKVNTTKCDLSNCKNYKNCFNWQILSSCVALPKSLLGKAIKYALGQKETIDKLLEYGPIYISNNTCEQAVKSLVIDRKNFLFSTSVAGADASASWLTLIESVKANGLDPQKYLTKILTLVPQLGPFPTESELETYLPWN